MDLKAWFERMPCAYRLSFSAIVAATAYYSCAIFGLSLSFKPDYIAALWPPNAILLAALFLTKPKDWLWYLLVVLLAELAADLPSGIPPTMALGFVGADWIEVIAAAILLRKFSKVPPEFNNLKTTTSYIICCVLVAPFVSAFPGALVTGIGQAGPAYITRWSRWFISDALTHLLITPFFVLWISWNFSEVRSRPFSYYLELLCLTTILLALSIFTLSGSWLDIGKYPAMIYIPLPVLLWASVRFGPHGIFSSAVLYAVVCVWMGSHGYGPFIEHSVAQNVINLQIYLSLTLTPMLFLSALIEDRRRAEKLLKISENQYRALFINNIAAILIIDPETAEIVDANPSACSFYAYSKNILTSMKITDINVMFENDIVEEMNRAKNEEKKHFNFRHQLSDKTIRDVEVYSGPITIGGKTMLCSIVHDIFERKRIEFERENLIRKLQSALSEVKTLRGFLPICASCKKIRDDKGYWNLIEAYISAHSDARFSHGLCPDCARKLYPDLDIDDVQPVRREGRTNNWVNALIKITLMVNPSRRKPSNLSG